MTAVASRKRPRIGRKVWAASAHIERTMGGGGRWCRRVLVGHHGSGVTWRTSPVRSDSECIGPIGAARVGGQFSPLSESRGIAAQNLRRQTPTGRWVDRLISRM